jgi:hypothetical protein
MIPFLNAKNIHAYEIQMVTPVPGGFSLIPPKGTYAIHRQGKATRLEYTRL